MRLKCSKCGTELLPDTGFCRQCGSAVTATDFQSEQPTAIFDSDQTMATQRLDARATGEPDVASKFPPTIPPSSTQSRQTLRWAAIAAIMSVLLICVIAGTWLFMMRGQSTPGANLIYPGARTVVDMKNQDGSRALQLETDDELSKVEGWYSSNLKLEKTIRLTENSVVLKSETESITLVYEDNKTSVLIKMAP